MTYRNRHDENYQAKLDQVASDIKSEVVDKLTLAIARQRYQWGDSVAKRLKIDLYKRGLLVRAGNSIRWR